MVYVAPTLGVEGPGRVNIEGNHRDGGRGGHRTVSVYFVVWGSVSPSISKYGLIILAHWYSVIGGVLVQTCDCWWYCSG